MRIIVTSDSHGNYAYLKKVIDCHSEADITVNLGDSERELQRIISEMPHRDIRFVKGNCDYGGMAEDHLTIDTGEVRIFCTHGHRYNVKYDLSRLIYAAREADASIILFGHTHERFTLYEDGIYIMNPGSVGLPRDGKPHSYGIIDILPGGISMNIADVRDLFSSK